MKKINSSLILILLLAAVFTQSATTVRGTHHSVTPRAVNITFRSAGAFDGWILESTETSGKGGSMDSAATTIRLGDDAQDRQYRVILSFDTSTIPANAILQTVSLKIKKQSITGTNPLTTHGNLTADIRKGMFSNNRALQVGDFAIAPSKASAVNFSKTLLSGWYTAVLGSADFGYVNRTGLTQFRLRFTKDDNDDRGADLLNLYSGNAGIASRPELIITYEVPDTIPPAAIDSLTATRGTIPGTVDLTWKAPGDDGNSGTAASYEIRYAASPITDEAAWNSATAASGISPVPQPAGTLETMTVTTLTPGAQFFFAVRAVDEAANRGAVSANSPWAVAHIVCGQVITEDTLLATDLSCPPETFQVIIINASNLTLDLGGHTISGYTPNTGVHVSAGLTGVTVRNGVIEGFNVGVYVVDSELVTLEDLTIRNMDITDPNHFLFGTAIVNSQQVVVRDSLFEFPTVAHKEAVEIFGSYVDVDNIEVSGGGAGVSFSFLNETCDPLNSPSNGTVRNSNFHDIYVAGIWIACSSNAIVEDNQFTGCPDCILGIQAEGQFKGSVTGFVVQNNVIHDVLVGIEFRGTIDSSILNNRVYNNGGWGIAIRQSLGCLAPQPNWECFYSTANTIADNEAWGNVTDLYHYELAQGNTWERNTCQTKDGSEIPECTPPTLPPAINYEYRERFGFFPLFENLFGEWGGLLGLGH